MHHWQRSQIERLLGEILYQAEVQHKPEKHLHSVNLSVIFSDWISHSEQILLSSYKLPNLEIGKLAHKGSKQFACAVKQLRTAQDLLGWSMFS